MRPLALDLACGKGGWSRGLIDAGWDVIGVDIERWDGYPEGAYFLQADVRKIAGPMHDKQGRKISLVVASPPCTEFSYRSFPFKRCRKLAATVPPDKSIWEACERIAKECNAPLVLENVRGAQKYMGKAKAHYGSFYLWGDVPALLPIGRPTKGFLPNPYGKGGNKTNSMQRPEKGTLEKLKTKFPRECERVNPAIFKKMVGSEKYKNRFEDHPSAKMSSQSMSRKEWSAKAAMIPWELAYWIGTCFLPKA
jgi:hypothetical protein